MRRCFIVIFLLLPRSYKQQSAASLAPRNKDDESDEATLLKDWDIARFFPSKLQQTAAKPPEEPEKRHHRRMESDSKIAGPFLRGFRREHSDFFPLSSRHSAVFLERSPLRSSGLFGGRRGSEAGVKSVKKSNAGEPVLTDFVKRNSESPSSSGSSGDLNAAKSALLKPRREKTESDIVLRRSEARRGLKEILDGRRKEPDSPLSAELEVARRRCSRPVDSVALSTATNSISGEDYLYLQQVIHSF